MARRTRSFHRRSPGLTVAAGVLLLTGAAVFLPRTDLLAAGADGGVGRGGQVVEVIDATTLRINGHPVRLAGIDAPQPGQMCRRDNRFVACGEEAATALSRLVALRLKPVSCTPAEGDPGRRVCFVDGRDVAETLVAQGHALVRGDRYAAAARQAEQAGLGLWSMTFVPPKDWRKGARLPGEIAAARAAARSQADARDARSQADQTAAKP